MTTPGSNDLKILGKRIIALILVVVSFIMLIFPLAEISAEFAGRKYTMSGIVDRACKFEGTTRRQFLMQTRAALSETFMEMEEETGIRLDARKAVNMLEKILSGKFSVLDGAALCTGMGFMMKDISEAMGREGSEMSESETAALMTLKDAGKYTMAAAVVLWVMIVILAGTFVLSILSLLKNQKAGVIAYLAASGLLLIGSLIFAGKLNTALQGAFFAIMGQIDDFLETLGGSASELMDQNLVHVTAAPFLSVICAAAATVLMSVGTKNVRVPKKMPGTHSDTEPAGWECPYCGAKNKIENRFCPRCGQARPEKAVRE